MTDRVITPATDDAALRLGDIRQRAQAPATELSTDPRAWHSPERGAREPLRGRTVGLVAGIANAGLGWLVAGLFSGSGPQGAMLGFSVAGVVLAALVARNRSLLARLVVPLVPLIFVWLAASDGDRGRMWEQARTNLTSGALGQPPVNFTPGWQLIFATVLLTVGASSVAWAFAGDSYRRALLPPVPGIIAATLIQPTGRELTGPGVAVVCLMLALTLAQSSEEARETQLHGAGRAGLLRAGAVLLAAAIGLGALAYFRVGLVADTVEGAKPAAIPIAAPVAGGGPLFQVRSAAPMPLRIGVLDAYRDGRWWTPAYQPSQVRALAGHPLGPVPLVTAQAAAVSVQIVSAEVGRFLPTVPGTYAVQGLPAQTSYDPRTGSVRLPTAAERGLAYELRSWAARPVTPTTPLATAPADATLPPAPSEVTEILAAAGNPAQSAARVRALRMYLFDHATEKPAARGAVGARLEPMPVERVRQILGGSPATAYELASAEGLLARWAGVPARLGYGYFRFQPEPDGSYRIGPADAAVWVEVQGADGTWLPLLDRPHKLAPAKPVELISLVPNGSQIAQLSIPMQRPDPAFPSAVIQHWLGIYAVTLAGLVALWLSLPAFLRSIRTVRRGRWAESHGPTARIVVAYAALRDKAIDLRIGTPAQTPLEFLDALSPDEDHTQLAWLVDRALWGDLLRGATDEDAMAAESLSASTIRRMCQGQTYLARLVAFGSHAALRSPWVPQLPSGYPRFVQRWWPGNWSRGLRRIATAALAVALIALPVLVGTDRVPLESSGNAPLPAVPATVSGDYHLAAVPGAGAEFARRRANSLIDDLALYTVSDTAGTPVAVMQTSTFKPSLRERSVEVRSGVLVSLGMTDVARVGTQLFYTRTLGSTTQVLWYSPDKQSYQLLTATPELAKPVQFLARLVATQLGQNPDEVASTVQIVPTDAREGK